MLLAHEPLSLKTCLSTEISSLNTHISPQYTFIFLACNVFLSETFGILSVASGF